MTEITPKDVERLLNGKVTDPTEAARIARAAAEDPKVAAWYDELSLDWLLPAEELDPVPLEIVALTRDLVSKSTRSVLWAMQPRAGRESLTSRRHERLDGELAGRVGGEPRAIRFDLAPVAEQGNRFRLRADLPAGFEPVCIALVRFDWQSETPAADRDVIPFASTGESPLAPDTAAELSPSYGLAAKSHRLAAQSQRPDDEQKLLIGESGNLRWELDGPILEVREQRPADTDVWVVAELAIESAPGTLTRQTHVLKLRAAQPGGERIAKTYFDRLPNRRERLTVRPLAAEDACLLTPAEANELLAESDFVTMPVEKTGAGFEFSIRWPEQERLANDPAAHWLLQVAEPDVEVANV